MVVFYYLSLRAKLEVMTWLTFAILTALLGSLASLYEKRVLRTLHSIDFSAAIAFVAALITSPVLFTASWEHISPNILLMCFGLSFVSAMAFLSVTRGIRHMEISLSSPLFLLGPLITTVLAFVILGELVTKIQMLGMLVILLGTYVLETTRTLYPREFFKNIWGNIYSRHILLGLFLYGFSSVGDRFILKQMGVSPVLYTAIIQFFIAIQFLFLTWYYRGSPVASMNFVKENWVGILVLALLTVGYRITQGYAVSLAVAVGLVIAIKRSSSLFTTIIGGELFHDQGILRKSLACVVMIGGVYLIAL